LRDKDKRAEFDAMKQSSSYGQQKPQNYDPRNQQQQQNQYQQNNQYQQQNKQQQQYQQNQYQQQYQTRDQQRKTSYKQYQSGEEFMDWYGKTFGDILKEFEKMFSNEYYPNNKIKIKMKENSRGRTFIYKDKFGNIRITTKFGEENPDPSDFRRSNNDETRFDYKFRDHRRRTKQYGTSEYIKKIFANPWDFLYNTKQNSNFAEQTNSYFPERFSLHQVTAVDKSITLAVKGLYKSDLGYLKERYLDPTHGSILSYYRDNNLVAQARGWMDNYKLGKFVIEDASGQNICTIEEIPQFNRTLVEKIKSKLTKSFQIKSDTGITIGFIQVFDTPFFTNFSYQDQFKNNIGQSYSDLGFPPETINVVIKDESVIDPSIFLFPLGFYHTRKLKDKNLGAITKISNWLK